MSLGIDCIAGGDIHWYSLAFDNPDRRDVFTAWFDEGLDLADAHFDRKQRHLQAVIGVHSALLSHPISSS